jgi:hypothetical protein
VKKIIVLFVAISIVSCKKSLLESEFNCKNSKNFSELKEYKDILKNFTIKVPKNWKTSLYFDEYSSEVHTADTTKQLTETYLLDISWKQGELKLDDAFANSLTDSLRIKERLITAKSGFGEFKNKPSYFNLSAGKYSGHQYQYLQVFIKTNVDEYITLTTKVFGDTNVDERLCESIELFEGIQLID